jgi:hypothetical protein
MNSVAGDYPVKYDLDCDSDGVYEYIGLVKDQKCVYPRFSGNHQISVRGDIPAMWLCTSKVPLILSFLENGEYDRWDGDIDMDTPECPEDDMDEYFDCSMPNESPVLDDKAYDRQLAVISIDDWGDVSWKSMFAFAADCENLNAIPNEAPNLSEVKDMAFMFAGASSFNQPLEHWDVSKVEIMAEMFIGADSFDQPLDKWEVSNVEHMESMFEGNESFSHFPSSWSVPNPGSECMFNGSKLEDHEYEFELREIQVDDSYFDEGGVSCGYRFYKFSRF